MFSPTNSAQKIDFSGGRLETLHVSRGGVGVYPPSATFGPRHMTDYEFVWIIEGGATAFYDEYRIDAPPGTVLLCRPGMTDTYEWSPEGKSIHGFFHFTFKPGPGWPPIHRWPLAHHLTQEDILRPLFRYVLKLLALRVPSRSSLIQPCVEAMLKSFISGALTITAEPALDVPPAVQKALALIRDAIFQQPSPPLELAQLARAAHVTPEHLCRLFRRALNRGPLECARLARLGHAAVLLARSNFAIKEISESTGFSNPFHFSQRFKMLYGVSPRGYRAAAHEGRPVPSNPFWQGWILDFFSGTH
jgi:AraC-like DNA-binding protein